MTKQSEMSIEWLLDNTKYSCSEILIRKGMDKLEIDSSEARKISSLFGGGIAGLGEICGAVTGAIFALGMKYGRENDSQSHEEARNRTRELCQTFQKEYSHLRCSDLTFRMKTDERKKFCHGIIKFTTEQLLKRL